MLMVMRLEDVSRYCNGDGGNAGTHSNELFIRNRWYAIDDDIIDDEIYRNARVRVSLASNNNKLRSSRWIRERKKKTEIKNYIIFL